MAKRNGTLTVAQEPIRAGGTLRLVLTATDGRIRMGAGGSSSVEIHRQTRSSWVVVKERGVGLDVLTSLSPGESTVATWRVPTNATAGQYRAVYHTVGPAYTADFTVCTVSNLRDRFDDDLLEREGVWAVGTGSPGAQELIIFVESSQVADRVHATLPEPLADCPLPIRYELAAQPVPETNASNGSGVGLEPG
jgi:hypothetical protein